MKYAVEALVLALFIGVGSARAEFQAPVPVRTVTPEFPAEMRRDHISGVVLISCQIDISGHVKDPQVVKSTNPAFTDPAVAALEKWVFKPAQRDGTSVPVRVKIPMRFVLDN